MILDLASHLLPHQLPIFVFVWTDNRRDGSEETDEQKTITIAAIIKEENVGLGSVGSV